MLSPTVVRSFHRIFQLLTLCCLAPLAEAQDLVSQPIPYTVLLDFAALQHPAGVKPALPIWLESVQILPAEAAEATPEPAPTDAKAEGLPEEKTPPHTVFRIRLRSMPGLNDLLLLRVFFDDLPTAHPIVTAWSEIGERLFASQPLGAGLGLPASESLSIPTHGVDYLEIDVPGDGANVRKVLLSTLKKSVVSTALDFAPAPAKDAASPVVDPFGNVPAQPTQENDNYLFGRVRATLEAGVIKLTPPTAAAVASGTDTASPSSDPAPQTSVAFEFNLEAAPLLAFVALDILGADPVAPLQAWVNDQPLGPVTAQFPDLADPAYTGLIRPLEAMRFRYAGWLHGQLILPGSALRVGTNTLILQLPADATPAAIRAIELQLKHNWRILDYTFAK